MNQGFSISQAYNMAAPNADNHYTMSDSGFVTDKDLTGAEK